MLLDLGLPDLSGLEVLRSVRKWSELPNIVVSARHDEPGKINALDEGADDYITKPFSVGELLARVRAVLRRASGIRKEKSRFSPPPTSVWCLIFKVPL
ncbi:response regulator [Corynebacterium pseudopelargi]|uniref:KDP operon transcriptional regulatory protein KdpE n=1 Tax=Corynebacterium pseudopelargi TaxID=2080757 RepID=A0A3G6IUQ7_9CORY|nr:KDP operon transcriptional regulatory protein KdpE [Corynebacterium pseudopelargi]